MRDNIFPKSFLIADDEKVSRDVLGLFLKSKYPDAVTHFAENGKIGVELYRQYMPDIVITDIRMPVKDGISMAVEIKEIEADAKIIAVSAFCDNEAMREMLDKSNFEEFLRKPLNCIDLLTAIENCAPMVVMEKED